MSIDLGFYDTDPDNSHPPMPFGHSDREYEDRMRIQKRANGICAAQHREWFDCLTTIGVGGTYRCSAQVRAYQDCQKRQSDLLRRHYEDLVKTRNVTSKELEVEQRLSLARAERDAQQRHTEELRDAARRELAEAKRASPSSPSAVNDADAKS